MDNITNSEIRSEEIDAILGKTPGKLILYSTGIVFGFILLILLGTMLFPYPEKIDCKFVITSSNPPIQLFSQVSGQIKLYVTDKQKVKENQVLALIDNPASITDVLFAEKLLSSLNDENNYLSFKSKSLKLGEITQSFLELERAITDFCIYIELNYIPQKIQRLKTQITEASSRKNLLLNQLSIIRNDFNLSKLNYNRDSLLYEKSVISISQLEKSKSDLYQKENAVINANIAYKNDIIQIGELNVTLLDLETECFNQKQSLKNNVLQNMELLRNQIKDWKKKYAFISPYDGIISFSTLWSDKQWMEINAPIMTILPQKERNIIGRMEIPIARSGKIKNNQDVILKLSNYPYMEYGVIYGRIKSISLVPYKDNYISEIEIPTLITNYGFHIPFNQQMEGVASVVIKDVSLFDRFIQPIKSSIINNMIPN